MKNHLVKSEELPKIQYTDLLPKTVSRILDAKYVQSEYTRNDFVKFLAEMIVILSIKDEPHSIVVDELFAVAKEKFADFSLGEMKLAFRMNTLQELETCHEHYQLFDLKFFSNVLIEFRRSRSKAKQRERELLPEVQKPLMSELEALYEWKQVMQKQFAEFKQSGVLECQFPNQLFDYLEKSGAISLTGEEKNQIIEKAKAKIVGAKKQQRLNPKNKAHLWQLSDFIKRATDNTLRSVEQAEIKQEARRMCIVNYYQTIEKLIL